MGRLFPLGSVILTGMGAGRGTKGEGAEARMGALRRKIEKANRAYYVLDKPVLSDAEYDLLLRELAVLEETAHLHHCLIGLYVFENKHRPSET